MPTPPWARSAAGANTYDAATATVLPTIYERTTAAAIAHGGINLGQGFPDAEGPQWLRDAAAEAISTDAGPTNQYSPGPGFPWFREAVAAHQEKFYGVQLDPQDQVLHTTGATEAIAATILAFATAGSEVVAFEPFYDSYGSMVALAGAELKTVPLRAPDFRPDCAALRAAVSERTSMILVNTPHNPTGAVFTGDELAEIVSIAAEVGAVVMSDEVYEHLMLGEADAPAHSTILSIPGAEDVAVAVGSAGKSFSVTGWKVGWVTGSPQLVNQVRGVKQFTTFCTGGAYQYAVAQGLQDDRGFFVQNQAELRAGRDLLAEGLAAAGLQAFTPDAGYFVLADVRGVTEQTASAFAAELVAQAGVGAIPVSSLTLLSTQENHEDELNYLLRFAFCKRHDVLTRALTRLSDWLT
ncbi:aminotransferase class I/II-fold pyridoxal phosphate-dependent enzyme [Nesterenkonia ebinurensis]|uniref:aminotransferase class I/II-fold pyridoxal phosphate-dependent enzyme n=1 Tax=Nesterenkonia ebinurensis TaxID=2608252 RepID=UPI00168A41AD|nr:aminotransferase class I/II-fold pyridoxal phosphate-dependent enzyme [Nesterenkonia ebinurensis]